MKAAILSNQARSMANFWNVLMGQMREKGMDIICIVPGGDEASEQILRQAGARIIHYNLDRKGLNPANDMRTFFELQKILKMEKPDLLFATTIKPVIYGLLAARLAGIPCRFATITGLCYAFETDSAMKKIINKISSFLYKISLKCASGIFFQNQDDISLFRESGILAPDAKVFLARGTGVDINKFSPATFPPPQNGIIFLLIARLLEAKGIEDYAKAAEMLKTKYPQARFLLLGPQEFGRGSIPLEQIKRQEKNGLEYLGESRDVRPAITGAHVVVLPSWREGTPTAIMEAMSMGRPCVVSDAPGCREVVIPGQNGWLCEVRNPASLAEAMEKFIQNPESITRMGAKSASLAREKFSAAIVARNIIKDMRQTCPCLDL